MTFQNDFERDTWLKLVMAGSLYECADQTIEELRKRGVDFMEEKDGESSSNSDRTTRNAVCADGGARSIDAEDAVQ